MACLLWVLLANTNEMKVKPVDHAICSTSRVHRHSVAFGDIIQYEMTFPNGNYNIFYENIPSMLYKLKISLFLNDKPALYHLASFDAVCKVCSNRIKLKGAILGVRILPLVPLCRV